MDNTTGEVALTNICRETSYFHDFVQYSPFLSLGYVLSMFFFQFWAFSSFHFIKKYVLKQRVYDIYINIESNAIGSRSSVAQKLSLSSHAHI